MSEQPTEVPVDGPEKSVITGTEQSVYVESNENPGRSPGDVDTLAPTRNVESGRHLSAASEVIHPDGWNEATHGPHPSTRLDPGV